MQSTSEGFLNIAELANQLRREKIFINSERQLLQNLNEEVEKSTLELVQAAWICSHQKQNLTSLITSRCEADSVAACQQASQLENTVFIDAHKLLKFKDANNLTELLGWLRDSPHLVALCLLLGEDHMPPTLPVSLIAGLYGSCRSAVDRTRVLAVIRSLIKYQLAPAPDPRKLVRNGKCALAQLFTVFRDGHTPARQFLVAALSGPVMSVLHEDEFFLDIDPDKAMERFSLADRQKKFGQTNSPEYTTKVGRYRKWTVQSLYNLTSQFIASLRENWGCFPPALSWIIQQITHIMKQHSRTSEREVQALCADIVFTHFICPAVVRPETHGVVDIPVSHIARSNLTQIAQILQVLSLDNYQEVDPKARDLYARFDRSSVASLVRCTGAMGAEPAPAPPGAALRTEPPAPRCLLALYTPTALQCTITFLKRISSKLNNNTPSVTSEEASSSSAGAVAEATYSEAGSEVSVSSEETGAAHLAALLQSLEPAYRARLHDLLSKAPDLTSLSPPSPERDQPENGLTKRSILAKVPKPRIPRSASFNSALASTSDSVNGDARSDCVEHPVVMVFRLANSEEHDYVGMVPESKVLECYYGGSEAGDADETGSALAVAGPAAVQKRTRFSLSHDEVSLGNTSDNLEAVSEASAHSAHSARSVSAHSGASAHSAHSRSSSLDLEPEDQHDNLSDMVSANVSGRGSPNISGRETPSSQVTEGDAPHDAPPLRMPPAPVSAVQAANAQKLLKQARNDIEDKFCKFEIKKLLEGDETISIMSDTWSTDVLASDSETIGDAEQQPVAHHGITAGGPNAPDVSETASESAWSMDVLASDSDRNTEVDTDDCVSVAARSDTSWPRRASQPDDCAPLPPLSTAHQTPKRPDLCSPRHMSRLTNRSGGYLSATAAVSRGGELDLPRRAPAPIENRKSILVNGYPVMTCYANSAPESPSTSAPPPMPPDVFDYAGPSNSYGAPTESTLEGGNSDATSQWVDDSFPRAAATPPDADDGKSFDEFPNYAPPADELLDRSLNSSESSFNALSVSHYDRRFDSGIDTERPTNESRSTITDLMTRMSSATISTSSLVNNITSRIVKSEIRTSVVSISSSRVDKKRQGSQNNMSVSSTLSVNSADSISDVNSELPTERRASPPLAPLPPQTPSVPAGPLPRPSTGAIPKSISFDATAEKTQRRRLTGEDGLASNLDELKNNMKRSGGNLLHRIKMFRQKGRHHTTNGNDIKVSDSEQRIEDTTLVRLESAESSEDILAKYRRKGAGGGGGGAGGRRASRPAAHDPQLDRTEGVVDLNDPEVFNSMKRKLRLVLSNPDLHCVEYVPNRSTTTSLTEWIRLASACASSEESAAHAGELARALATSGADSARLAAALRADLAARRPYAAYLASCRAGLTHTLHLLNRQVVSVRAESSWAARAAASCRALEQLERGPALRRLHARHSRPHAHLRASSEGELMDEKASRLTASIKAITAEIKADPAWDGASPALLETAEVTVERAVFARLYLHVLFPNGDGDIARDQVLSEHIRRLSASTSAAGAGVAARHLWAAPFPRAQRHLRRLCVARAPRDKVSCVMRCVTSVMAVLGLTAGGAVAADDLTPVLVYVIIKVNPPSLLSTVELVGALGGPALQGEALYWWTHFCAAVAYIKTMDYPRDP